MPRLTFSSLTSLVLLYFPINVPQVFHSLSKFATLYILFKFACYLYIRQFSKPFSNREYSFHHICKCFIYPLCTNYLSFDFSF